MKRASLLRLLLLAALVIGGALVWLNRPAPPRYTVTDLGVLPGYPLTYPHAINNQGEIVGTCADRPPPFMRYHAFLYRNDIMTDLTPAHANGSQGNAINDNSEIVGTTEDTPRRVFLYRAGKTTYLNAPAQFGDSLNDRGQVVGIAPRVPSGYWTGELNNAFLYSAGKMSIISPLPGDTNIDIANINNSGQVLGKSEAVSGMYQAIIYDYQTKKMTALKTPNGCQESYAFQINDRNQIIGVVTLPGDIQHIALWENSKMTDLGSLPNQQYILGLAINNEGDAVGTGSDPGFLSMFLGKHLSYGNPLRRFIDTHSTHSEERAFVYHDGKMTDLNSLIPSNSHWTLEEAAGINDKGQIIGTGLHNGKERAFLLTPIESR